MNLVPVIPESAPFTKEQRAYLNGFLAGLFSRAPVEPAPLVTDAPEKGLEPLSILFASQTGNAERLAKKLAKEASKGRFAPTIHDLADYPMVQLAKETSLLIVTSTYGDGEPPDNAKVFWESLSGSGAPQVSGLRFSVCALGDTSYPKFCGFGKDLDARLEALGGCRINPRMDCDVDYEEAFVKWMTAALSAIAHQPVDVPTPVTGSIQVRVASSLEAKRATCSRDQPFAARLLVNRRLNGTGSSKDVRHVVIGLAGSDLTYEAGDALGILPQNSPCLVKELLEQVGAKGEETVAGKDGRPVPLREALTTHYEITRISRALLEAFADKTGDGHLRNLVSPSANGSLTEFLWGREVIDLFAEYRSARFNPTELVTLLRKLPHRLYSISSSPKLHVEEAHLTVGTVRYESRGRRREGVCSTFLADRLDVEGSVSVFVHTNKVFRLPAPETPVVMVGPGTGIAPFRAFLEERQLSGARGKNWLFFGDQRAATDYLYREEIEGFEHHGLLTRLDLAWSRDQPEKIYVQHRMLENARELFGWLEEGGYFYVCGDANRMAKDVDRALHEVVEKGGNRTADEARAYVTQLKVEKRYLRDVY